MASPGKRSYLAGLVAAVWAAGAWAAPPAAGPRLDFVGKPVMLDCSPASSTPCFRMEVSLVGTRLAMSASERLSNAIRVRFDDIENIRPFYVAASGAAGAQVRYALLLIDISGSMSRRLPNGQSRFEGAKAAAKAFLRDFDPRHDRIAVVPFESHQVVSRIRSATFGQSRAEVERQIDSLPAPRGNTALFAAVSAGLDVLAGYRRSNPEADTELVLLTDGKNDVRPGDDPELNAPEYEFSSVLEKVDRSATPIVAIGLGSLEENEMDQMSLKDMGGERTYFVNDAKELQEVFAGARQLLTDRLRITFRYPHDKGYLSGRNHTVEAALYTAYTGGSKKLVGQTQWIPPDTMAPEFEAECDAAEKEALLLPDAGLPLQPAGWIGVARPILVFAAWGAALLTFWFLLPRFIWPERYTGRYMPAPRPSGAGARPMTMSSAAPSAAVAPPGAAVRRDTDATVVADSFNSRTRLK